MNLILIEPGELRAGEIRLSDARADHIRRVLNGAPGQSIRIGVVDGPLGMGTIASIDDRAVQLRATLDAATPPLPAVDLLLALPRPKVLRRLWAQLSALGVGRIILTNAARVERNYFDTHLLSPEIYRPLLLEGLQQARDTRLSMVSVHRQLKVLVEDDLDTLCPTGWRVAAHPGADRALTAVVRNRAADGRVLLGIGPEGGWNAFELGLLNAHGFELADAGPRTLRSDTASIVLLALVHDAMRQA